MLNEPPGEFERELHRLGINPEYVGFLILPVTIPLGAFLERLRDLPDQAGLEVYETLMDSLPWPDTPPWRVWPDPGSLFTYDEYVQAFRFINGDPESLADHYAAPPRSMDTTVLALLSYVSPTVNRKVSEYLARVTEERMAAGLSPEIVESGEAEFNQMRVQYAHVVEQYRNDQAGLVGTGVSFMLGPEFNREQRHAFFEDLQAHCPPHRNSWLMDSTAEGTPGGVQLRYGVPTTTLEALTAWLRQHSMVRRVEVSGGTAGDQQARPENSSDAAT